MKETEFDRLLNIHTSEEQMGFPKSFHYNRYEPTPYSALNELFKKYQLSENDRIVDFGCGKGRLNFYIYHLFKSTVTGIDMNEELIKEANDNLDGFLVKHPRAKGKIHFHNCMAEDYNIHPQDNRFYFFNPFSIQIFIKIINHILLSIETHYRSIDLILFYPSEDYTYYLDHQSPFVLREQVHLDDDYEKNPFEKFLIYRFNY